MTYAESNTLMSDADFTGRVKVACLKFADSIMNEPSTQPAHTARLRWASACFQSPAQIAIQVTPPTVMDPNVQSSGAAIDDAGLQAAVEATADKFF